MVSGLAFTFLIHFELIFVYDVMYQLNYILLNLVSSFSSTIN